MKLWGKVCGWVRITVLEGRLQRRGYRRLHEHQVAESHERSKRVIHDLADAVLILQATAEQIEDVLEDMTDGEENDR